MPPISFPGMKNLGNSIQNFCQNRLQLFFKNNTILCQMESLIITSTVFWLQTHESLEMLVHLRCR